MLPDNVRVVVDCGANIGITSLFLAARYPRAKILSIEPHPGNFALLKANVETVPRLLPIRACVTRDAPKYGAIHCRSGRMGKPYWH
jgi:FkbM family methyltransferase